MTILIISLIIVGIIGIYLFVKNNSETNDYKSSSDSSYKVNVSFPHPEKANDYRFYKFVETTSSVILEPLLPEIKRQGMKLKPEFETAIKRKIETGEFENPLDFKEYFGDKFDLIGLHFLKGTSNLLSAFQIGLCFIKDEKIADTDTHDFSPPKRIIDTKKFQKTLEQNDIDPEYIDFIKFTDLWNSFELKNYLNNNLIVLWDEESEILRKILLYNKITDFNLKYVSIREIAEKNNLPTLIDLLLEHFDSELKLDEDLSLITADLATDLIDAGISLEKYMHYLTPSSTKSVQTKQNSNVQNINNSNFVALDVETAQGPRWSICQIGLAIVDNGSINDSISYLIQPPENKYQKGNMNIHGITPEITKDEPLFPQIWQKVLPIIENKLIVAHNTSFDIDCLKKTLTYYNLEIPNFKTDCTFKRTGDRLDSLCEAYDIELTNHHDAVSDAIACAKIYIKLLNKEKPDFSKITPKKPRINKNFNFEGHEKLQGDILKPDLENANPDNPFYKKKVVFTGILSTISRNEAAGIVKKMGADINTTISKKTDFVITGQDPGPSKMNKIIKHNNEGSEINIIYEKEFIKMTK